MNLDVDEIAIPKAAIAWLFGIGPDPAGLSFGDFPDDQLPKGKFWWRSSFAAMVPALKDARSVEDFERILSALTPSPVPTTIPAETSGREGALDEAAQWFEENVLEGYDWLGTGSSQEHADRDRDEAWKRWRTIRRALTVPEEGNRGWLPIETAPKDEPFLGVRIEEGKQPAFWLIRSLQLRYDGEDNLLGKGYRWNAMGGMYNVCLTHWMRLPAAPARTGRE
jgi:hypothetical protein